MFFIAALFFAVGVYAHSYMTQSAVDSFRAAIREYPENRNIPEDVYAKYYDSVGPATMLDIINERAACHLEGHNLGKLMYEHTSLPDAVLQCLGKCYNGCTDGVLIGFVEEERQSSGLVGDPQPEDLTPSLMEKIRGLCDVGDVTRSIGVGACFHALGHVYSYFTDSNISQTLDLCRTLHDSGDGAVFHCAAGLYMQRSADYNETDIQSKQSRLYPCDVSDYPAACYRYRLSLLYGTSTPIETVVHDCGALEMPDKSACFHALGLTYYKQALENPALLNTMCATTHATARRMCLDGVLGRLATYGIDRADMLCEAFQGMPKAECLKSAPSVYNMRRDYSTYLVRR